MTAVMIREFDRLREAGEWQEHILQWGTGWFVEEKPQQVRKKGVNDSGGSGEWKRRGQRHRSRRWWNQQNWK